MLRAEKAQVVDGLRTIFSEAGAVVVAHYKGMSVAEMTALRRSMRDQGAGFQVAKNRLVKVALDGTEMDPIRDLFTGPTGIAYSADAVAVAKAATAYAKKNDKFVIIGGGLGSSLLTPEQVKQLADMPSIDELRAKILGVLNAPATRLVGVLNAAPTKLVRVLNAPPSNVVGVLRAYGSSQG